MYTVDRTPLEEVSLGELCAALQQAFLEETGDEELAWVVAEAVLLERLLDGTWRLDAVAPLAEAA